MSYDYVIPFTEHILRGFVRSMTEEEQRHDSWLQNAIDLTNSKTINSINDRKRMEVCLMHLQEYIPRRKKKEGSMTHDFSTQLAEGTLKGSVQLMTGERQR